MVTDAMRDQGIVRVIQAITSGAQAGLGIIAGFDILSPKGTVIVMALIAVFQVGVATWNQGLANDPIRPYVPPKMYEPPKL